MLETFLGSEAGTGDDMHSFVATCLVNRFLFDGKLLGRVDVGQLLSSEQQQVLDSTAAKMGMTRLEIPADIDYETLPPLKSAVTVAGKLSLHRGALT